MESSSATSLGSRFRFRDHAQSENASDSDTDTDISSDSVVKDDDEETELDSMTAKGIKRLCMELLEIKAASDEDFHKNIFSNYSSFVGTFEDVKDIEKELMQLKNQVSMQKKLVNNLINGIYLKTLSDLAAPEEEYEYEYEEPPAVNMLEDHITEVADKLDVLLAENRADEAISFLKKEEENLQKVQIGGDVSTDLLKSYSAVLSERKDMLALQLTLLAKNSRIAAPELQKALSGLCKLGDSRLATQLLLKHYHTRIVAGIDQLENSESFLLDMYSRDLSKLVFSMISQAAKSFVMLHGETVTYASELVQWAREEVQVFVGSFTKYAKSISDVSCGLSSAVEAVQFALSYCSLLESQGFTLRPYLIKLIRPCAEEVLEVHIEHFKKVIGIFTATDSWVLSRYIISGVMTESYSSAVFGQESEYCLLTNSGRKFVTLLQAMTRDVVPLVSLRMQGSILRGLMNLFMEYMSILETAMTHDMDSLEKSDSEIIWADSVPQQVSILANLSTLEHFYSSTMSSIFGDINRINSELMSSQPIGFQQQQIEDCVLFIQEASSRLRSCFCEQYVYRLMTLETECKLTLEKYIASKEEYGWVHDMMPSLAFQGLFVEFRQLENLAEHQIFEPSWLMELLSELIDAVFIWISKNKEIWEMNEHDSTFPSAQSSKQFVLDMHFLMEITRHGGYLSDNPSAPVALFESAFVSVGLDPDREAADDGWAINAATEAIKWLLEIELQQSLPSRQENAIASAEEIHEENHPELASRSTTQDDNESSSSDDSAQVVTTVSGVDRGKTTAGTNPSQLLEPATDHWAHSEQSSHAAEVEEEELGYQIEEAAYERFELNEEASSFEPAAESPEMMMMFRSRRTRGGKGFISELEGGDVEAESP
ncbi:Exocyst complex component EXO84C [Linum perenne]